MNDYCEEIRDKIAAAMAGGAEDHEDEEVADHLRTCPDCRAYSDALAEDDRVFDAFARAANGAVSRVETKVMQAIRTEDARRTFQEAARPRWRGKPLFWLAAAAVVVLAIASMILLDTSGNGSVVWADVIARVEDADEYICRRIEKRNGEPPLEMVEYRSAVHGLRQEIYQEGRLQAVQRIVPDEKMLYALKMVKNVAVKNYVVDFKLVDK